jgi:hypothetical protein
MAVNRRCETVDLFAEFVQSDATTFLPGHMGRLSELDPACPGGEIPGERFVGDHVADELLPLFFESVLKLAVVEDLLPVIVEVVFVGRVRVPLRLGGV